jgi:hypothetical protein
VATKNLRHAPNAGRFLINNMAEYNIGDKVILKDDGQVYTVVGVRTEDRILLFDLEQGDERVSRKLTVLRSQLEVQKAYTPKRPQTVIYKKNASI